MASTQLLRAFDRIPSEIWVKIAQALPAYSLYNFVLSSRKLYISGNPLLYRSIYFLGTTIRCAAGAKPLSDAHDSCFGVHRFQSWLSHPDYSSPINDLNAFFKTVATNSTLKSHVTSASFEWDDTATTQDILVAKRCLEYIKESLSLLHLGLPKFDPKFAITANATFLEIAYPDEKLLNDQYIDSRYDVDLHKSLRKSVYLIFCIPTLQHLSLKSARTWHAFEPLPPNDDQRVGTSNIISLSLPDTVPLSRDLKEILTWPKALRYIYHDNVPGDRNSFQNYGTEQRASPEVFIDGLQSQRNTIEELFYNNTEDRRGHDGTTFGFALRDFVNLKRLAVSRDCLVAVGQIKESQPLYEALPPNLEEAWIQLDNWEVYADGQLVNLDQRLRGIAVNKARYCPSLRSLVLWMFDARYGIPRDEYPAEARRILDALYVFPSLKGFLCALADLNHVRSSNGLISMFEDAGIYLDLTIGQTHKFA